MESWVREAEVRCEGMKRRKTHKDCDAKVEDKLLERAHEGCEECLAWSDVM